MPRFTFEGGPNKIENPELAHDLASAEAYWREKALKAKEKKQKELARMWEDVARLASARRMSEIALHETPQQWSTRERLLGPSKERERKTRALLNATSHASARFNFLESIASSFAGANDFDSVHETSAAVQTAYTTDVEGYRLTRSEIYELLGLSEKDEAEVRFKSEPEVTIGSMRYGPCVALVEKRTEKGDYEPDRVILSPESTRWRYQEDAGRKEG